MATWKQVVFSDDVPNLGGSNLTQSSADRVFSLKQRAGDTTKKNLRFIAETTLGATSTLVDIETKDYIADGSGTAAGGRFTVNTENINLNASATSISSSGFLAMVNTASFFTNNFKISASQNDDLVNPRLKLQRSSTSPADGDLLGEIAFNGQTSDDNYRDYATITASIVDATNDTEDGALDIKLKTAGSSLSALKITPEPSASELSAGSASNPVFYSDNIDLYGKSLRQRLLNEIGVTTPFSCIFYPTVATGIQSGYEIFGITNQDSYSTIGTGSLPNERGRRYATAQTTSPGDALSITSRNAAFDISEDNPSDLGGASWIVCHHKQSLTPSISGGEGRVYDFACSFFYKPEDFTGTDTLDNEQTGTIRIYQATTTSGVLATSSETYSLVLMAKQDIVFEDGADLTTSVFTLSFDSNIDTNSGHDVFVVSFENTGPQTLGSNDDNDEFGGTSVPFIKGEVTRRIANKNDT